MADKEQPESTVLFSYVLKEIPEDFSRWELIVSEFRGEQYLAIREFFLDFDGEWQPSKKGVTVPLEITFTKNLFDGLKHILSEAEVDEV